MPLLTIPEVLERLSSANSLSMFALQQVIDGEDQAMEHYLGAHFSGEEVAEELEGGQRELFLSRPIHSDTSLYSISVVEYTEESGILLEASQFYAWRLQGRLTRLMGSGWAKRVVVRFVPANDSLQRKAAMIEILRLIIERTAMKSENIAGEYSFSAPDWERERIRIYRRFGFIKF
jgi:hypothetical protein